MSDEFADVFEEITASAEEKSSPQPPAQDQGSGPENPPDQSVSAAEQEEARQEDEAWQENPPPSEQSGSDPQPPPQSEGGQAEQSTPDQEGDPDSQEANKDHTLSQAELAEMRRKAHGYDSMLGRLQKEQEERRKLEQRLARLEGQRPDESAPADAPAQPAGPDQESSTPAKADIPEEMQDDVTEFRTKYPDYADLVEENSDRGQDLRTLLQEYGPAIAAVKAESVAVQERLNQQERQRQQSQAQAYWKRIENDHPEVVQAFQQARTGEDASQAQSFLQSLNEWIDSKPRREAERLIQIRDGADADAAAQLISDFKNDTGWGQDQAPGGDSGPQSAQQSAQQNPPASDPSSSQSRPVQQPAGSDPDAAAAVPSRPSPPPSSRPAKDDFDGAWEEATHNRQ